MRDRNVGAVRASAKKAFYACARHHADHAPRCSMDLGLIMAQPRLGDKFLQITAIHAHGFIHAWKQRGRARTATTNKLPNDARMGDLISIVLARLRRRLLDRRVGRHWHRIEVDPKSMFVFDFVF